MFSLGMPLYASVPVRVFEIPRMMLQKTRDSTLYSSTLQVIVMGWELAVRLLS